MNTFVHVIDLPMRRLASLVLVSLWCAAAGATDLLQVYRLAEASDPTFDAARHTLESVQERIPQARAGLLPVVNITSSDSHTRAETGFSNGAPVDRNMKSWAWSLQLTQPLLRLSNVYAYRESEFIVQQAHAQFALAEQDLLLRVAQAYFGVIVAQEAIAAAEAELQALNEQLAQVQRGFKLGTHAVTDVDETKARLGTARAQRVVAQNDLENKRADLEKITGEPISNLATLQSSVMPPPPLPMDSRSWIDQARSSNPAVLGQQAALSAAIQTVKKNRVEYLPTLDLVASYGNNYASSSLTTPNDFSTRGKSNQVGLQLNIPLSAGGATNSKVREAIANMKKTQADVEASSRQVATDAQQAFAGVTNGLAQIEALTAALESGHSAVKGNRAGYSVGIRINLDVLNAEQQLYTARRDLTKARYETLLQGLKLKAAAGALGEADLLGVNALLLH